MKKCKFFVTPYHYNLLKDTERLSAFYEAIKKLAKGIVYDLGTGSGIFSYFAAPHAKFIFAIEKNEKIANYAKKNLYNFKNVKVINKDVFEFEFPEYADTIICEMLDTALIDEKQVPVMNKAITFLKENGNVIPLGVINCVEPVDANIPHIIYERKGMEYKSLGKIKKYNEILFLNKNKEKFKDTIRLQIKNSGILRGIKIITFTLISEEIICGPTPMMNTPIFIPVENEEVRAGDTIKLFLSYRMGGGLNTIKAKIKNIF